MSDQQPFDLEQLLATVRERAAAQESQRSVADEPAIEPRPPLVPVDAEAALAEAGRVARDLDVPYRFGWQSRWLGPLWMRVRQWVHREVRIYTDGIIGKQQRYNAALLDTTHQLAAAVAALNANVAALNAQAERLERLVRDLDGEAAALEGEMQLVAELRAAVADLQARVAALEGRRAAEHG
jgi:cell division protein FtsB